MKQLIILLTFLFTSLLLDAQSSRLRLPAEWEKQERVYLSWFGSERRDTVLCRVIQALAPDVPLTVFISDDSLKSHVINKIIQFTTDTLNLSITVDPYADFWIRDPIFFVFNNNELTVGCFDYSVYGTYPDILEETMPEELRRIGELDNRIAAAFNLPVIQSNYVFEAGGIETNGKGTFLIIKEMALQRNPSKTLVEIENELQRTLGAKKIIWLKDGLAEDKLYKNYGPFHKNYFGGGANMHIDELCRFVDENTVILPYISKEKSWENPVDSINYFMLEENHRILRKARTYKNKKINIHRVPMPEIEQLKFSFIVDSNSIYEMKEFGFKLGDTIYRIPAASYMNYFVSNKTILIPKYWKPGMNETQRVKDEEAKALFQKLFPTRRIVQIYTLSINRGGGGIHCMTHELPVTE